MPLSKIKTNSIANTASPNVTSVVFTDGSSISSGLQGFKNRIINGSMVIDQRNVGTSVIPTIDGQTIIDRFNHQCSTIRSATSIQQVNVPAPLAGFTKALKFTATSASTVGSSDFYAIGQQIEGYNWADLNWGTLNAKTITFSCWVYGSITGTFGGLIKESGQSRSYPFLYTISAANTWTQVTVTIPGDTSGTYSSTNTSAVWIELSLACGSSYLGAPNAWNSLVNVGTTGQSNAYLTTSGATFYTTGWQIEKNVAASNFEYRPYSTELALCQRYFCKSFAQSHVPGTNGTADAGVRACWVQDATSPNRYVIINGNFPVTMRTAPTTVTIYALNAGSPTTGSVSLYNNITTTVTVPTINGLTDNTLGYYFSGGSNGSTGTWYMFHFTASAEL